MNTDDKPLLIDAIVAEAEGIKALRHRLHAHPELGYEEFHTADLVAECLQAWGIPVHRGLGKTGVVGVLRAGQSSRAIGLRADMDALPIQEQNRFAHASTIAGKMHACGHDGHVAMLLAAAQYLVTHARFDGSVYLIFQPAEEGGAGADAMIQEGLFDQFPMQAVFGLHNWPGIPAGQFAIAPGPVMAAFRTFRIQVCGRGGHAALPHRSLDPIPVAAQIVGALQTIVSRNIDPLDAAVVSVTTIHAGQATNVIADSCEMTGTVRAFSNEVMALVEARIRELVQYLCAAHGMEAEFEFYPGYPPTVNHPQQAALARGVMVSIVGEDEVLPQRPTMGAEDFAFMLQHVPGCYAFIGSGTGVHRSEGHGPGPCELHNASYDFNDEVLSLGATYWVRLVEACLPCMAVNP